MNPDEGESAEPSRRTVLLSLAVGATAWTSAGCAASGAPQPPPTQPRAKGTGRTRNRATSSALLLPLHGKIIVIDPGHNGGNSAHPDVINTPVDIVTKMSTCDTAGAQTASGYTEHAFNWDVANRLRALLEHQGATVFLTRGNDHGVGPCINQRAAIGNRHHADAAVSIHADGAPSHGHGFHIIEPAPVQGHNTAIVAASARLGVALRDAYHHATGVPYSTYAGKNGVNVRHDLGGLNFSRVPKVFIECANMNHAGDAALLVQPTFRERAAHGLAAGFLRFLTERA
jgi:N-acetylmuramoyl-L-alanine amidase